MKSVVGLWVSNRLTWKGARSNFLASLFAANLAVLTACGGSAISKGDAKKIIEAHFSDSYGLMVPLSMELNHETIVHHEQFQASLNQPRIAHGLGLVTAIKTDSYGQKEKVDRIGRLNPVDRLDFSLAARAEKYPHWIGSTGFWFITAHNEIVDVLQVTPTPEGTQEVLFAYVEKYSPLGLEVVTEALRLDEQLWTPDGTKFRGKAILRYDDFLKKFVLLDLRQSDWQTESWKPAVWVDYGENGKLTVRVSKTAG